MKFLANMVTANTFRLKTDAAQTRQIRQWHSHTPIGFTTWFGRTPGQLRRH
jgi:hypothetical protein